jgi:hypothetical protein
MGIPTDANATEERCFLHCPVVPCVPDLIYYCCYYNYTTTTTTTTTTNNNNNNNNNNIDKSFVDSKGNGFMSNNHKNDSEPK